MGAGPPRKAVMSGAIGTGSNDEAVGRVARGESERRRERLLLRNRQPLQAVQERTAQLIQTCEGQFHLALDTDCPLHPPPGRSVRGMLEERRLAHARFTADDQRAAAACCRRDDEPIDGLTLAPSPSKQHASRRCEE
jgi:hypothetical protein